MNKMMQSITINDIKNKYIYYKQSNSVAYSLHLSFLSSVYNNKLFNFRLAAECDEDAKSNTANTNVHICNIIFQQFCCEHRARFPVSISFSLALARHSDSFQLYLLLSLGLPPTSSSHCLSLSSSVPRQRGQKVKFSFGTTLMYSECVCMSVCLSGWKDLPHKPFISIA